MHSTNHVAVQHPESVDGDDAARRADDQPDASVAMTALTTEHFTLQTARAAMVNDASSRMTAFLTAVSASLVALAFVGQASEAGAAFYATALTVLPVLTFLGAVTVERALQIGVEDDMYALAVARIREQYVRRGGLDRHVVMLAADPDFVRQPDGLLDAVLTRRMSPIQVIVATPAR